MKQMQNDIISVIIPVYNRQDVLEECVRSVRNQTYQNIRIILINDGSTDETALCCRKLAEEDDRIRFLDMEHGGVSAARNLGLEAADGKYVFFMDSDDVIHPMLLETLAEGMEKTGAAMAGTDVLNVAYKHWERVPALIQDPGPGETVLMPHRQALHAVFREQTPINMIGGVMMLRELIGNTRFSEELFIGEDFWFIYENLIKGADVLFLKQKWYYGRLHQKNSSWNFGFDGFQTRFLRRQLVWESEERFGRAENAALQKQDAFFCYERCLKQIPANDPDVRKMCSVMKKYSSILVPALRPKVKLKYYLAVYAPGLYKSLRKLWRKMKRR